MIQLCNYCGKKLNKSRICHYVSTSHIEICKACDKKVNSKPKTQKARGIWALSNLQDYIDVTIPAVLVIKNRKALQSIKLTTIRRILGKNTKFFARPCPKVPRHGFIESREINSKKELLDIWDEIHKIDKKGELLIMSKIDATHNVVLVVQSGVVAVGHGHDGATSSKEAIQFPVIASNIALKAHRPCITDLKNNAGISLKEDIYLELLREGDYSYCVQARGGPALDRDCNEYIPFKTTPKLVLIPPPNDLLGWEKEVAKYKGRKDVVAWAPEASLACHAAIHCVLNKIPFLTRKVFKQGQTISPPNGLDKVRAVDDLVDRDFVLGYEFANKVRINSRVPLKEHVDAAATFFHNISQLRKSPYYSILFGWASTIIFKAAALSCIQERGHYNKARSIPPRFKLLINSKKNNWQLMRMVEKSATLFTKKGCWLSCYGGKPWKQGAELTVSLLNNINALNYEEVIKVINNILNLSHNTGSFLSKISNNCNILEEAATMTTLAAGYSAPVWFEVIKAVKSKEKI